MGACLDLPSSKSATDVTGSVPVSKDAPLVGGKSVLLLEDDSCFKETIKDFLSECGYAVTTAGNGAEGVEQVLARDFSVVLCDMMMPTLSGEMFYRAVRSARPHLCERFIFMTGHRGDPKTNFFMKSANARALMKPFSMSDLMETISRVASGNAPGGAEKTRPPSAPPVAVPAVAAAQPKAGNHPAQPARRPAADAAPVAPRAGLRAPAAVPQRGRAGGVSDAERGRRGGERSAAGYVCAAVSACVLFGVGMHAWSSSLRARIAASESDLHTMETEWTTVSAQLEAAEGMRPRIETLFNLPKRVAEDRQAEGWAPLLEAIATSAGPETILQEIHAQGTPADPGACELRLDGFSTGLSPTAAAGRFLQALKARLASQFHRPVTVRFEKLEDKPVLAPGLPLRKASFTITATVGAKARSVATRKLPDHG